MILRRHIHKLLSQYYQQPHNAVVGSIQSDAINFKNLLGEWHWRRKFSKLYKEQAGQWLTPVELFRPFYSQILANFIAKEASGAKQVHIVELGGGRGTNAKCILDHLQQNHPDIYNGVQYTIMDSSPTLLELQRKVLLHENSEHDRVVHLKSIDMLDVAERRVDFLEKSEVLTIVIAMELLDNLPHDKISVCNKTGTILQTNLYRDKKSGLLKEVFVPLEDDLLSQIVNIYPSYIPLQGYSWIPSAATQMLTRLFEERPNAGIVLADFDYLPPPDVFSTSTQTRMSQLADGEPLVTDMNDVDYECYLTSPPLCDILFPTDFEMLRGYVSATMKETLQDVQNGQPWDIHLQKQSDFLAKYGPKDVEETKSRWSGYTPVLEDFSNCSVISVSRSHS